MIFTLQGLFCRFAVKIWVELRRRLPIAVVLPVSLRPRPPPQKISACFHKNQAENFAVRLQRKIGVFPSAGEDLRPAREDRDRVLKVSGQAAVPGLHRPTIG